MLVIIYGIMFFFGAIDAIKFLYQKTGYFEMKDVLNLKKIMSDYLEKEDAINSKRYIKYAGRI